MWIPRLALRINVDVDDSGTVTGAPHRHNGMPLGQFWKSSITGVKSGPFQAVCADSRLGRPTGKTLGATYEQIKVF